MKGAIRFALIAVLCWLGLAQAYILWGPRRPVESGSQTSGNNTWAVTGCGSVVDVAYTSSGHAWFSRSTDAGATWNVTNRLDDGLNMGSSSAPSLVKLDEEAQYLIAVFWTDNDQSGGDEVWCRGSTDYGADWGAPRKANGARHDPDDPTAHVMYGFQPSASAIPAVHGAQIDDREIEVVWRECSPHCPESIGGCAEIS